MTTSTVSLFFAAVNLGCANPAGLADFWGKVLGRPVSPGVTAPDVVAVGTTDPGGRPQMVFYPAPEAERVVGGFVPTLQTEHHDEEAQRLTGLGAKLVNEAYLPPIRLTVFADPEGNRFQLATGQSE
jgi:predicted enzyme related to lactoylglutathione lyase